MQQLQNAISSVPAITAVATLTAACIAALVAVVVAYVNAWSTRRIAIDTAHRAYRAQQAEPSLSAARKLLSHVDELELINRDQDEARWNALVTEVAFRRGGLRQDLPTSNDEVFAAAVRLFVQRRAQFYMWLRITTMREPRMPRFGMTEALKYISEAANVLETAAEAYIFNLPKLRRRAACLLKEADTLALKRRIDARRKVLDDAFGPDDEGLVDAEAIPPEELAGTGK